MTGIILEKLSDLEAEMGGEFSLAAFRLDREGSIEYKPDLVVSSASIIKIPILITFLRLVAAGKLSFSTQVSVQADPEVAGSGVLRFLHRGIKVTAEDLAALMIIVSDNVATNMLIDLVGFEAVAEDLKRFGCSDTRLERKMYDWAARAEGKENVCTAREIAWLLALVYRGAALPEPYRKWMIDTMRGQLYRQGIPFLLPETVEVANKTGEIELHHHDAAVVEEAHSHDSQVGHLAYAICITTRGVPHYQAQPIIARASRLVYDHWTQDRGPRGHSGG